MRLSAFPEFSLEGMYVYHPLNAIAEMYYNSNGTKLRSNTFDVRLYRMTSIYQISSSISGT
jgi:hypothetical protein